MVTAIDMVCAASAGPEDWADIGDSICVVLSQSNILFLLHVRLYLCP